MIRTNQDKSERDKQLTKEALDRINKRLQDAKAIENITQNTKKPSYNLQSYVPTPPPIVIDPLKKPSYDLKSYLPSEKTKPKNQFLPDNLQLLPKENIGYQPSKETLDLLEKYVAGVSGFADSATLGLFPTLQKSNPDTKEIYEKTKKIQDNQPVAKTIGNVAGYILPSVGITKALKSIPVLSKVLPKLTDKTATMIGKTALTGAIEGGVTGGVEGSFESIRDNKPFLENVAKRTLENTLIGGVGAGVLGGAFKGASNVYENTIGFKKALEKTKQAIDEYKFPELNIPEIKVPERKLPTISPDIPAKYRQPVQTTTDADMPLGLPSPQGTYLRPMAGLGKTFTNKTINLENRPQKIAPTLTQQIENLQNLKNQNYTQPQIIPDNINLQNVNQTIPQELNATKTPSLNSILSPENIEGNINLRPEEQNVLNKATEPLGTNTPIQEPILGTQSQNVSENVQFVPENVQFTPKKDYTQIKTEAELPTTEKELADYVNTIQTKLDNGELTLLKVDLTLFGKAKEKLSRFATNTLLRQVDIDQDIIKQVFDDVAKYSPETVNNAKEIALDNVTNKFDETVEKIKNATSLSGLIEPIEAELISKIYELKYKQSGDIKDLTKLKNWLKTTREKITETGRAMKGIDVAWEKSAPLKTVVDAEGAIEDVIDVFKKNKSKKGRQLEADETESKKLIKDIKDKTNKEIDDIVTEIVNKINKPNKAETNFPEILKNKIVSYIKPKTANEESFIKQMINDLFGEAKENITPKITLPIFDTMLDRLGNSYKYREYYGKIRNKAKQLLQEEFKDDTDTLKLLNDYFEKGFKPPHSEGLLNKVLSKRLSGLNNTSTSKTNIDNDIVKQNITNWVKDWYATGRYEKENFINSLIKETGLEGETANSLKNLLDSRLKEVAKKEKDRLLSLAFADNQGKVVSQKTTVQKLSELVNLGMLENRKFINKISTKIKPAILNILKENKINLRDVVTGTLAQQDNVKATILRDILRNARIDDVEINKLITVIKDEFQLLSAQERDKMLSQIFKATNVSINKKTPMQKISELVNLGAIDNEKFSFNISSKIQPQILKILKENNISLKDVVKSTITEQDSVQVKLLKEALKNANVDDARINDLFRLIKNEFSSLKEKQRSKMLLDMTETKTKSKTNEMQNFIDKINLGIYSDDVAVEVRDKILKKYDLPSLDNDDVKFIMETMESVQVFDKMDKRYIEGYAKVMKRVIEKMPSSIVNKEQALRYITMLLNAKSLLVNAGGNTLLFGLEVNPVSNSLRIAFDKWIYGLKNYTSGIRTAERIKGKEFLKGFGQGINQTKRDALGGQDLKEVAGQMSVKDILKEVKGKSVAESFQIITNSMYKDAKTISKTLANPINTDITSMVMGDKFDMASSFAPTFKNEVMRIFENMTSTGLKFGDLPFNEGYFQSELQSIMRANNVTVPTDEMKAIAFQVSSERTFKDNNIISASLLALRNLPTIAQQRVSNSNNPFIPEKLKDIAKNNKPVFDAMQIGFNQALPFAKTPGALLKRGIEYSPLGLVEGAGKMLWNKGRMTGLKQREIVDRFTRGTMGTLLYGLGMLGYWAGNITGAKSDQESLQKLKEQEGILPDALQFGNTTIDLKKAQPASSAPIAGARLMQGNTDDILNSLADSVGGAFSLYTDNGLVQNLSNVMRLFGSSEYDKINKGKVILDNISGIVNQYNPALAKQISAIMDDYERNPENENATLSLLNKTLKNVPQARAGLPVKVDVYGNPIKTYEGSNNALNVMLNPIKSVTIKNNPVSQEIIDLSSKIKDSKLKSEIVPKDVPDYIGKVQLTTEQQNQYQKIRGDKFLNVAGEVINNPSYKNLDDEEKGKLIKKVLNDSLDDAKIEMEKILNINTKQIKEDNKQQQKIDKALYQKFGVIQPTTPASTKFKKPFSNKLRRTN